MSTDNREPDLFPDVLEHYGSDLIDHADVPAGPTFSDLPIPPAHHESDPAAADSPYRQVLPVIQGEADTETDAPAEAIEVAEGVADDPLAHAPDWARAHLPRHALAMPEQPRRGLAGLSMRPHRPTVPGDEPVKRSVTATDPTEVPSLVAKKANPWIVGGAAVTVLAVAVAAAVTFLSTESTDTAVPPLPESEPTTTATTATVAAATQWCADATNGTQIVGRGAGDQSTGPGLIQAFDHAYYVAHDGAKVASLMVTADPAAIQKAIDALPANTEHCLAISPTPDPNVFDVALTLRTSATSIGTIPQRITLTQTPTGLKIAKLEEVR